MHILQALLMIVVAGTAHSQSVAGISTRFWDCCKSSCSWSGKADFSSPVTTCDINDQPLSNGGSAPSGCDDGGTAFTCSSQQPWAINDNLAYGFAAVTGSQSESETCCACYKLTFTSAPIAGKVMIVQATNIGFDVSSTQFDLAIPGGGVGAFPAGCTKEWHAPAGGWGQQFGGVSSLADCATLPSVLQPGCSFRFDWMQGADNPAITYERVICPAALTSKTNCVRADDGGSASSPSAGGTSSVQTAQTSTKSPVQTAEKATQTLYGQCGGLQWTGPTICPISASCKFQNDYYSQCLTT